ncbi:MAG: hypothetical protein ACHBN1_20925 [Heteroscytonema crispum UTEX LB 1556]
MSVISCQLSVVSCQLLVIQNHQPPTPEGFTIPGTRETRPQRPFTTNPSGSPVQRRETRPQYALHHQPPNTNQQRRTTNQTNIPRG